MEKRVAVIGGGLAGSEAAWQLATLGIPVDLYEMRPVIKSPAHHTSNLAELVCSNSLGSFAPQNASALLKDEMRVLGSKILEIAYQCQVPAGNALAVDRDAFAQTVTATIENHPLIKLHRQEMPRITGEGITIIATGPLTSEALAQSIRELTGAEALHFFDAASPILTKDSIDMDIVYAASRYEQSDGAYLNCAMNKEQYQAFMEAILSGERVELKEFEKDTKYFEGCLPVEVIASRGFNTLRFGPMKPVGLQDPRNGKRAFAVVQLRQDNAAANLYNMVGFQTNLKWPEQKRIFKLIPGLENAEFVRLGVMHRNTYMNSPLVLRRTLQAKANPNIFFAGQLTGVEGYTESTAVGLIAARNAARVLQGKEPVEVPSSTMLGALIRYITTADPKHFQPINSNWGIIDTPPDVMHVEKEERRQEIARRARRIIAHVFEAGAAVLA